MYLTGDGYIIHLTPYEGCGGFIEILKRILIKSVVKRDKLDVIAGNSDVIVNNSLDGKLQ